MGFERMYFARFIVPAVPPLLILATAAVHSCARWAQAWARVPQKTVLAAAAFVLITRARAPAFVYDQIYAPLTELAGIRCPGPTLRLYRLAARAASR